MPTQVDLSLADGVARITLAAENGIQLLDASAREQLNRHLAWLEQTPGLRAVVFLARGRTFLAGADIKELAALNPQTAVEYSRTGQNLMARIERLPCWTAAWIHAAAAGGGCELSLACDEIWIASGARMGLPEVTLGLLPGWGGTVRLLQRCGESAARSLILTGRLVGAEEALRIGLASRIFDDSDFHAACERELAGLPRRGPRAVGRIKRLLARLSPSRLLPGGSADAPFALEAQQFAACFHGPEAAEGIAAFLEKRAPVFEA